MADPPSQALQQTLKSLSRSLSESFDPSNPKEFPVFKRKYKSGESSSYPQGFEISNNHIFLPKVGWVGFRKSRHIKGNSKNVTVFKEIDHWYISIQTESKIDDPVHPSTKAVGIDLCIKEDDCLVGWDIHPAD
jgi:putative transposase